MAQRSLSAAERETIVRISDVDDEWFIETQQRPIITRLRHNPAAELVEEGFYGSTAWAVFRLPKGLVTFRKGKPRVSASTQRKRTAVLAKARKARQKREGKT